MKYLRLPTLLFFYFLGTTTLSWAAEDPNALVSKADQIRAPAGSYEIGVVIRDYQGEQQKSENEFRVYVKDLENSLVEFTSPAPERGKSLLMVGEDLWIYLPKIRRPVRIPLQERLVGNIANGDMARSNFANDYESSLAGEETLDGKATYVLDLTAKSPKKTYSRIKYWISKTDQRPVKAEYFTVSGKSLKTCRFEDFRPSAGAVRPMRLVFLDSLDPSKKSILQFQDLAKKRFETNMFTKDYMKTLE